MFEESNPVNGFMGKKTFLLKKINQLQSQLSSGTLKLDEYKKVEAEIKETVKEYNTTAYDPEEECLYNAGDTELVANLPTYRNDKFVLSQNTYGEWYIQDTSHETGAIQLTLKLDVNGNPIKVFRTIINSYTEGQPQTKSFNIKLKESVIQAKPKPLQLGTGVHSLIKNAPLIDGNCTQGLHSNIDLAHPERRKGQDFVRKEDRKSLLQTPKTPTKKRRFF